MSAAGDRVEQYRCTVAADRPAAYLDRLRTVETGALAVGLRHAAGEVGEELRRIVCGKNPRAAHRHTKPGNDRVKRAVHHQSGQRPARAAGRAILFRDGGGHHGKGCKQIGAFAGKARRHKAAHGKTGEINARRVGYPFPDQLADKRGDERDIVTRPDDIAEPHDRRAGIVPDAVDAFRVHNPKPSRRAIRFRPKSVSNSAAVCTAPCRPMTNGRGALAGLAG
jgi:hypothetical protein